MNAEKITLKNFNNKKFLEMNNNFLLISNKRNKFNLAKTILSFILIYLFTIILNGCSSGRVMKKVTQTVTQKEKDLIAEGLKYHDADMYDRAIEKYKEVLNINPLNLEALYEISLTYSKMDSCETSLKYSQIGLDYDSELFPLFAIGTGNCLDDLGKTKDAIKIYKEAIEIKPDVNLLHFNLGLSYMRLNNLEDAEQCMEESIELDPEHASSHYYLSEIYKQKNFLIPAMYSICRFLILEPNSFRSFSSIEILNNILNSGLVYEGKVNKIYISDNIYTPLEMTIKLHKLHQKLKDEKEKNEIQRNFEILESVFIFSKDFIKRFDRKKIDKNFTLKYYIPYFIELYDKKFTETFTYLIFSKSNYDGVEKWISKNQDKIKEFYEWSFNYYRKK